MTNEWITFLAFCGGGILFYCCGVGAAFTFRWGWTGIEFLWGKRTQLTRHVRREIRSTIEHPERNL